MTDFDDDSRLNAEEMSLNIGTTGLTAAAFDYFGLKDVLRGAIGKVGSHVVLDNPELVQALVMQVLSVPYQSLYGTSEFFQDKPIAALPRVKHVELEDLNRVNLARCLDEIYNFGPERLFLRCAKQVAIKLGAHIEECHLDSTSFHYDGQTREEEGVDLILDKGYSRDGLPELNQVNHLQICDAITKIPFFFKSVSGHVHDKTSFRNLLIDVAVTAKIKINDSKVEQAVKEGSYFVVCTNDMKRKWTQKDLLGIYKRQSVVERNWKCFKERKIMVSALYLKTPHRISALMWIFSMAMLIYTATEYLIRQRMKDSKLTIPSPDHKQQQEKPTLMRLYQYISNSNIG